METRALTRKLSLCLVAALSSTAGGSLMACSSPADPSTEDGSAALSDDKSKKDAGSDAGKTTDAGHDAGSAKDAGSGTGGGGGGGGSGEPDTGAGAALTFITEPEDGITPFYDFVASAKSSVDMTMYELSDTTMTSALTAAAKRGVAVRVILDQNSEKSINSSAYKTLTAGGVSVHWANPTFTVTHQKTITVDHERSAVMTLNLDTIYYSTSRDFAVITDDANDVEAIETTFGDDFTNTSITPPTGDDLVWSPTNAQASLLSLIEDAKSSLAIENEEMEDSTIISALIAAAKRGVSVKVVMTDSSSYDSEFKQLVAGGVKVVTYASTASLYIHAKAILADYGASNASAFLGSENFSTTSLGKNRELGLITSNAAILSSLEATLASDYAGGTAY